MLHGDMSMLAAMAALAALAALAATAECRVDGQPWPDACETMDPGGGPPPQATPMPYEMRILFDEICCDESVHLTIKGNESNEFAGFMVQARENATGRLVGKFVELDDVRLIDCGGPDNTAVAINYLPKEEVILKWLPDKFMGTVHMYATVAKDYLEQVYWLKQKSIPVKIGPAKYTN